MADSIILTDKKSSKEDQIKMVKSIAKNIVNDVLDDLTESNVLNRDNLRSLGEGVSCVVNNAENLLENITEKTQIAGKILMNHLFSYKNQLSLKLLSESEDNESEKNSASSSSSTESEEEDEESSDKEEAGSAQAVAVSPTAPQEIQGDQLNYELKLCPPDDFHKLRTEKADEIYPVIEKKGRTRQALIICNKVFDHLSNRYGSEIDVLGMEDLLENLGYSVTVRKNLTAQEMETELRLFAARPEHQSSDSTFLVFMSHGILNGICGTKHSDQEPDVLHDDIIFEIFNNRNCRSLKDKPKVIIMQACRGRGSGIVWMTTDGPDVTTDTHNQLLRYKISNDAIMKAHVEKDFIAFKSSTPYNVSWRLDEQGSVFISLLIYHFKKYSWSHHLEEIFRKVQRSFEIPNVLTQMPTIERVSITRYFYLFPGN
ncbi:caspase-12-like [Carlito syrichta]|uniref:Caspase-12-like n=1 Tax=Carlito syrichta TaxID=1868482 RepID=A0A1U7UAW7_CARSF|nr:caspase-12-like [Carlito syrichta]